MRGIQYAAASRINRWRLWNTGSSAFADDDGCGFCGGVPTVIASEAKQSISSRKERQRKNGLLRNFAPRNHVQPHLRDLAAWCTRGWLSRSRNPPTSKSEKIRRRITLR